MAGETREGSLDAPTRHALQWQAPSFFDTDALNEELERVYDICHGCRRCVSLCNAFPTLFDLVDESETMEVDGVAKADYMKVVDHCYLCDLCYMTKCPYVPPHEWNVDFPHLMLRAKMVKHRQQKPPLRDRILSATDAVGKLAGIPIVVQAVNATNRSKLGRGLLSKTLSVHKNAHVPEYHSRTFRKRWRRNADSEARPLGTTRGRVAIFSTCYGNYNEPQLNDDLQAVFEHNGIPVQLLSRERCCGMPKLELGDIEALQAAKDTNIPALLEAIDAGCDIVAVIPSCVLMFKQELPLLFPDDADVAKVRAHMFDPFEYLMLRHKEDGLKLDFTTALGKIAYHAACHLRVQNIGLKTRDLLSLVPDTEIEVIERCSGHDGTYAVKQEYHDVSRKICRPVARRVTQAQVDSYSSDCPMAGRQIATTLGDGSEPEHPVSLLRKAYGI
ncbi:MAG: heterodisulfide reductase-related iron-sulfur binding cluster [Gammaproteobacteria bacterium]|nr:heterodisulfide reductase-related iron-sulfur binding cluster [Gammaproteobacteria bacterium]